MKNPKYKNPSAGLRINKAAIKSIWDMTVDMDTSALFDKFVQASLQTIETKNEKIGNGSGPIGNNVVLSVQSMGPVDGPYGTADNTYADADADPELPGFSGIISQQMDWRADCDPAYQYIRRATPRSFGYASGYLTGDGNAPNGLPVGTGTSFPAKPLIGDYFLRIDYLPQLLFRWDGNIWVRISSNVRTGTGWDSNNKSQLSTYINNSNVTILTNGTTTSEKQSLSSILKIAPDVLPPIDSF